MCAPKVSGDQARFRPVGEQSLNFLRTVESMLEVLACARGNPLPQIPRVVIGIAVHHAACRRSKGYVA